MTDKEINGYTRKLTGLFSCFSDRDRGYDRGGDRGGYGGDRDGGEFMNI